MNIVAYNAENKCYYLAFVQRMSNGHTVAKMYKILPDGSRFLGRFTECESRDAAEHACKKSIKNKIRYGDGKCCKVKLTDVPEYVKKYFAPDLEDQITPSEVLTLANSLVKERYVILSNNTGIEDHFDTEIQYVGADNGDPDYIDAYDKRGNIVSVSRLRIASIQKTEDCLQAEKIVKSQLSA